MRVLFCTDGSKISFNALENFSMWIDKTNATVDTICAIDWSFLPAEISIEEDGFSTTCANIADGILETAKKDLIEYGFTDGEEIKVCGSAVDSILDQLKRKEYDLILLGSHGRKGIQKWLGSVSGEVISNSSNCAYISKSKNEAKRILFPIDGSKQSFDGVKYAIQHYNLKNKEIVACIVNEEPETLFLEGHIDVNWQLEIERNQQLYAVKVLKKMTSLLESNDLILHESVILKGNISQKVLDLALKNKIDLICLTSRNLPKFQKFLLGSVSKRILNNTQSDVLMVKTGEVKGDNEK